jgi:Holliday junction resolvase RusA-like endonuclease
MTDRPRLLRLVPDVDLRGRGEAQKKPAVYRYGGPSRDEREAEAERIKLEIPGKPVPLQRARTGKGRHYLPVRSRAYRQLVQETWMAAGRPSLGGAPLTLSARFYGARANADLDNLVKAILDALNTLAFDDDRQIACFSGCHRLPVDAGGARCEVDLWACA